MDEQLAQLLGWHKSADGLTWEPTEHYVYAVTGSVPGAWEPTVSLDDCAEAEAEIGRRGLLEQYADVLACNLGAYVLPVSHQPPSVDYAALGALITAPPEARVRAMLAVLQDAHQ